MGQKVTNEQKEIINSNDKYISVSATAGSGKTFTLLERAKVISKKTMKKILVISFTNASVNDIKNKIDNDMKEKITVMTFDSLFITLFRKYQHLCTGKYLNSEELKININSNANIEQNYFKEMLFTNNVLLSSSNVFKEHIIKMLDPDFHYGEKVSFLFSSLYKEILIDESQDMDIHQINFLKNIKLYTECSITLFGDLNQSIYEWRGANPKALLGFIQEFKFNLLRLSRTFRCPEDVYEISRKFIDEKNISSNKTIEYIIASLDTNTDNYKLYQSIDWSTFFTSSNREWLERELSSFGFDLEHPTSILIPQHSFSNAIMSNELFNNFKIAKSPYYGIEFVYNEYDSLLKAFFNNDIKWFIENYDINSNPKLNLDYKKILYKKFLCNREKSKEEFGEFLKHFLEVYENIDIDSIENDIKKLMPKFDEIKKFSIKNNKQILTTFSSKGLEFDNVIICLSKKLLISDLSNPNNQLFEKIFVSLTRAKKKVIVVLGN